MKALILAAGEGRRIAELSEKIPKPLIPLISEEDTCLTHTLNQLLLHGITEIYISLGYKYEVFTSFLTQEFIPKHPKASIHMVDARPQYKNGPIHSFMAAEKLLIQDPSFLVLPGDTIFVERVFHQLFGLIKSTSIPSPLTCSFPISFSIPSHRSFNYSLTLENVNNIGIQLVKSIENFEYASKKTQPMEVLIPILILPGSFFSYAKKRQDQGDNTLIQAVVSYFTNNHPLYDLSIQCTSVPFYDMDTLSDYDEIKKYLNIQEKGPDY